MQAPELTDKYLFDVQETPVQFSVLKGIEIIGISEEQLSNYGAFLNDFYARISEKSKSNITRNASTMLRGAAFAISTKSCNLEWKEHCASSLREIGHQWKDQRCLISAFSGIYCNNKLFEEEDKSFLKYFMDLYSYFSAIAHHNACGISGTVRKIKDDQNLKTEDCLTDATFFDFVRQFFRILECIVKISTKYS